MHALALTLVLATSAPARSADLAAHPAHPAATSSGGNAVVRGDVSIEPTDDARSFIVAPKLGVLAAPAGLGAAFDGALEVGYVTPLLDHRLAVALEGAFTQPGKSGSVSDPRLATGVDASYKLTLRQITLGLSAVYRFEKAWQDLTPYVGLGPTLSFDRARTTAFGATTTETAGRIGALAQVGAEWALWHGGPLLEVRYHLTRVDFLSTGNANAGGLGLLAGYRFRF